MRREPRGEHSVSMHVDPVVLEVQRGDVGAVAQKVPEPLSHAVYAGNVAQVEVVAAGNRGAHVRVEVGALERVGAGEALAPPQPRGDVGCRGVQVELVPEHDGVHVAPVDRSRGRKVAEHVVVEGSVRKVEVGQAECVREAGEARWQVMEFAQDAQREGEAEEVEVGVEASAGAVEE